MSVGSSWALMEAGELGAGAPFPLRGLSWAVAGGTVCPEGCLTEGVAGPPQHCLFRLLLRTSRRKGALWSPWCQGLTLFVITLGDGRVCVYILPTSKLRQSRHVNSEGDHTGRSRL